MKSIEGKFAKHLIGIARVLIEVEVNTKEISVKIDLDTKDEWNNQFSGGGFRDWFEGAIYGAKYGLEIAKVPNAQIKVKRIIGQIIDTTPTTVAAATAFAVWEAFEFQPS
jgi:hypothetical protein